MSNMTLQDRLSKIATSNLPNGAALIASDDITVGDVREIMHLLADREGWIRAIQAERVTYEDTKRQLNELFFDINEMQKDMEANINTACDTALRLRERAERAERDLKTEREAMNRERAAHEATRQELYEARRKYNAAQQELLSLGMLK